MDIDRIRARCEIDENGCWNWLGATASGYPRAKVEGVLVSPHRIAAECHHNTKIPPGYMACHHCDNPKCCNPEHIFIGSRSDNMKDAARKGRLPCQQRNTRLDRVVPEMLQTMTIVNIAKALGVSEDSVRRFVRSRGLEVKVRPKMGRPKASVG